MPDISARITVIISGHLGIDAALVVPNASLINDLGADCLDTVELVIAFEEAFSIEISHDDAGRICTVQDAIDHVRSRIPQR